MYKIVSQGKPGTLGLQMSWQKDDLYNLSKEISMGWNQCASRHSKGLPSKDAKDAPSLTTVKLVSKLMLTKYMQCALLQLTNLY